MALIICPECGHKISDKAVFCPYCGMPYRNHAVRKRITVSFAIYGKYSVPKEELPDLYIDGTAVAKLEMDECKDKRIDVALLPGDHNVVILGEKLLNIQQ